MLSLIQTFDLRILYALLSIRTDGGVQTMIWLSELGRATTVCGLALCLVLLLLVRRKTLFAITLAAAAFLTLAIGFARLYLGVHYPSDVFAGYVLGAACLWVSIWTVREYSTA